MTATSSSTAPQSEARSEGWLLQSLRNRAQKPEEDAFFPTPPKSLEDAGVRESQVEALILKFLWNRGVSTGTQISDHIRLPFGIIDQQLRRLKEERMTAYKRSSGLNDYFIELTESGFAQAKRYDEQSSYFGSAPVPFQEFVDCVAAQSPKKVNPSRESLEAALSDLAVGDEMLSTLGQALTAGNAVFLYGTPGNGKTSIAERVTAAFGKAIWIPRCLDFDGDIVRLFDPIVHQEVESDDSAFDKRWVKIERPTIIVGGELEMGHLELSYNEAMGISEAPMQLKSSCGTFVIDDFGRQKMEPTELLNRWIVPLEKHYDFLNLPSGKKIQVPFDQLLIFSTNLEPKHIVDEAFLRRIPYKLEVKPPTEPVFRKVFEIMAKKLEIGFDAAALDHLLTKEYHEGGRPFRFCQPRDLLLQVKNYCIFHKQPIRMSPETLDIAAANYFGMM